MPLVGAVLCCAERGKGCAGRMCHRLPPAGSSLAGAQLPCLCCLSLPAAMFVLSAGCCLPPCCLACLPGCLTRLLPAPVPCLHPITCSGHREQGWS
jgi:hypothetical protein